MRSRRRSFTLLQGFISPFSLRDRPAAARPNWLTPSRKQPAQKSNACSVLKESMRRKRLESSTKPCNDRHIGVVQEECAISSDGMKMFGVLDLETQMEGCRFSIGIRNSHDKSIRLGLTAGLRVFVCSNMAFSGDFTPVLAKHTKSFNLIDTLSVGVDRIQRNFEPLQRQVELWRKTQIYFQPEYEKFAARTHVESLERIYQYVQRLKRATGREMRNIALFLGTAMAWRSSHRSSGFSPSGRSRGIECG